LSKVPVELSQIDLNPGTLWFWRAGDDNVALLLEREGEGLAIDLPDGPGLMALCAREQIQLREVWFTHGHHDHVRGLPSLPSSLSLLGPPGLSIFRDYRRVHEGERLSWQGLEAEVLETPGHSDLDICFVLREAKLLFCGDLIFDCGCGRMFAGPAPRFWQSLQRLKSLPGELRVFCGHDYTGDNLQFSAKLMPEEPWYQEALKALGQTREACGMPLSLQQQLQRNLFLGADRPEVAEAVGFRAGTKPAEVFAELRQRRNGA